MLEQLVDIRDSLAKAKCLTAASWLACGSPILSRDTGAALSAVTNIVREQLEDLITAIDKVIAAINAGDG